RAVCCCCRWKLFSSLRANSSSAAVSPRLAALPWTGGRVVLHASPGGRNCGPGCDPHQHAVSPADHRLALAQASTPGLSPAVSHVALSNSCPAGRYWIHLCTVYTQRMDEGGPLRPCNRSAGAAYFSDSIVVSQRVAFPVSECSRNCRSMSPMNSHV